MKLLPQRWAWSSLHVVRASAGLSSMFRPTIHFQTNQTDSTCDRTEASVSELLHHISVTTRPSSIQQFIKAHFLLFYWQTDTTVVIILLSDSMKSNCCRSFCWQAPVSLPQASAPTRRTALTYKSFNGNQYGSPSHRTAQNLSACSSFYFYTKRRQKIWINVKKETCSWTPSVILQVSHIYNKTETL